jgi:hypothetical protein
VKLSSFWSSRSSLRSFSREALQLLELRSSGALHFGASGALELWSSRSSLRSFSREALQLLELRSFSRAFWSFWSSGALELQKLAPELLQRSSPASGAPELLASFLELLELRSSGALHFGASGALELQKLAPELLQRSSLASGAPELLASFLELLELRSSGALHSSRSSLRSFSREALQLLELRSFSASSNKTNTK